MIQEPTFRSPPNSILNALKPYSSVNP
jgi:hypothetical protein